jgi:long-chain acyl-CoA synthetase
MYPREFARLSPEKAAAIMAETGEAITFGALERNANQGAHVFRSLGLAAGDVVAIFLENNLSYLQIYWAAQRAGLYITPISTRLTPSEAAYIVNDSGSQVLITSADAGAAPRQLIHERLAAMPNVREIFYVGEPLDGARSWQEELDMHSSTPIGDESAGFHMVYSSGTTGRPKGIKLPLVGGAADAPIAIVGRIRENYGVGSQTVYLSPAPMYHTAPLMYSTVVQRCGGTVVIMKHFDPEAFLAAIEKYRVTFTQMVPTMFVRLLKLAPEVRARYDLSSLKKVVHAAAPCPVPVKRQMLDWLGPIIYEYYGASEGSGSTFITPEEWLQKPGSVGRASGSVVHICDDEGRELPCGETGTIYFEGGLDFRYHNDAEKTSDARHRVHRNWTAVGDVGRLDADGYLYLTDRKAFMIISGGVNIYPQEVENVLVMHPKVADAAVFGIPNDDFGEEVKAVVQPMSWSDVGPAFEQELLAYCRAQLSAIKCPRSIDFDPELPRHATGKLYKKVLRDRYWTGRSV